MTNTASTDVIDLATAQARALEKMAKAEQEADRQRVEAKRAAEQAERDAKARRDRAAKLQTKREKIDVEIASLQVAAIEHVKALSDTLVKISTLGRECDALADEQRTLLGEPSTRWGNSKVEAERWVFIRNVKATLRKLEIRPAAFFQWLDQRAVEIAQ